MADYKKNPDLQTSTILTRAQRFTASWSPEVRGYVALALGTGLLLFSLGYFQFFHALIGAVGIALMIWGIFTSNLLEVLKDWFEKVKKWFS
jgi:hypothetical protein